MRITRSVADASSIATLGYLWYSTYHYTTLIRQGDLNANHVDEAKITISIIGVGVIGSLSLHIIASMFDLIY